MKNLKQIVDELSHAKCPKSRFTFEVEEPVGEYLSDITSVETNYLFGARLSKKVYRKVVLQGEDADEGRTNIIGFNRGKG